MTGTMAAAFVLVATIGRAKGDSVVTVTASTSSTSSATASNTSVSGVS